MKRCPTCNLTFEEEWLAFCTQDGTSLIEDSARSSEPPPTMMGPPMPPSVSPNEQPTLNLGGHTPQPPPASYGAPAPMQGGWQPPPPPAYVMPPNKSVATASMVVGIISTIAWLCIGPIPAIVALVLGIVALSQIKKNPDRIGGTTQAWVGILTGGLTTLIYAGILVFYIIALVLASQHP